MKSCGAFLSPAQLETSSTLWPTYQTVAVVPVGHLALGVRDRPSLRRVPMSKRIGPVSGNTIGKIDKIEIIL